MPKSCYLHAAATVCWMRRGGREAASGQSPVSRSGGASNGWPCRSVEPNVTSRPSHRALWFASCETACENASVVKGVVE